MKELLEVGELVELLVGGAVGCWRSCWRAFNLLLKPVYARAGHVSGLLADSAASLDRFIASSSLESSLEFPSLIIVGG